MKRMNRNAIYKINSKGHLAMEEEFNSSTMVIRTLTPEMQLTEEQIKMLEEAEKQPITYEDDCPELTPEMAKAFREAAKIRDQYKGKAQ